MCMSTPKMEAPPVIAPPSPAPTPTPTDVNPVATANDRASRLRQFQYGLASTIKTSPSGITGTGPNLNAPSITGRSTTGS